MPEGGLTWAELEREARSRLAASEVASGPMDARFITEEAAGFEPGEWFLRRGEPATEKGVARFDAMLSRRLLGEPLQYVLGHWGFRRLDLMVDRRVLIPRPETETLVDLALTELAAVEAATAVPADGSRREPVVVDLGTGSGAIALAVAVEHPRARVWGTDVSPDALTVARANLAGVGRPGSRVRLVAGDWYSALPPELRGNVDLVTANPPYISPGDEVDEAVTGWEPEGALIGGGDGFADVAAVIEGASTWLRPGGVIVVEMDPAQVARARLRAEAAGLVDVAVHEDQLGRSRFLVAHRGAAPGAGWAAVEAVLSRGGIAVVPTDTVYGLVGRAGDEEVLERIRAVKRRPDDMAMAVLVGGIAMAEELAEITPAVRGLLVRHWPGGLTAVLTAKSVAREGHVPLPVREGRIGLRCPDRAELRELIDRVGPLVGTSANLHGRETPETLAGVRAQLGGLGDAHVDGGRLTSVASTVVDLSGRVPVVIRQGPVVIEPPRR